MRKLRISKHAALVNNSRQIRGKMIGGKFLITDLTTFEVDFINAVTKWFKSMFVASSTLAIQSSYELSELEFFG